MASTSFTSLAEGALRMIASGRTAAALAAKAADPSAYDHYRTPEGLRVFLGDLAGHVTHMVPGDDLAAERAAFDMRLAEVMRAFEGDGWTPAEAAAALRDADPRSVFVRRRPAS